MTPQIALDLSLDGIAVLSRAPDGPDRGKWYRQGIVRLDAPDMAEALRRLRGRCAAVAGEDFTSILVIPDTQLLFTSLERDDRDPKVTIRSQLAGRTPYAIEDLAFDYAERGDRLQVAVVARETLREAESFAADFGFRPVAHIAAPRDPSYDGIAQFGPTALAPSLTEGGRVSLDLRRSFDVVPAPMPEAAPEAPTDDAEPKADFDDPAPVDGAAPAPATDEAAASPVPPTDEAEASTPQDDGPFDAPSDDPARDFAALVAAAPAPVPSHAADASEAPAPPPASALPDGLPPAQRPPSEPVMVKPPAPSAVTSADPVRPAFSSRRKPGAASAPLAPRLGAPRLAAAPAPPMRARAEPPEPDIAQDAPSAAPPEDTPGESAVPGSADDAPADDALATESQPEPARAPDATPPRRPAALAAMDAALRAPPGGRLGRIGARIGMRSSAPATVPPAPQASPMAADGALSEAQAFSLPGRGRAAKTPRRGSARLGLYLTLSLLALLGAVALWAVAFAPGDLPADNATPMRDPAVQLGVVDAEDAPPPVAPAGPDLASLLPEAGTAAASPSALVAPPMPVEMAEAAPEPAGTLMPGTEDRIGVVAEAAAPPTPGEMAEAAPEPAGTLPGGEDGTGIVAAAAPEPVEPLPGGGDAAQVATAALDAAVAPGQEEGAEAILAAEAAAAPVQPLPEGGDGAGITAAAADAPDAPDTTQPPTLAARPGDGPGLAAPPEAGDVTDIYVASIDSVVADGDAVALPAAAAPADAFAPQTSPPPAGTDVPTGADGLVVATPEGVRAPDGYRVVAGQPAVMPVPRAPDTPAAVAAVAPEIEARLAELRRVRPTARPGDAEARVERASFGGLSRAEITRVRPSQRPEAIVALAATAEAETAAEEAEEAAAIAAAEEAETSAALQAATASAAASLARPDVRVVEPIGDGSRYALAASDRPLGRPRSVEQDAARIVTARRERASAPAPQAQAAAPQPQSSGQSSGQTIRSAGGSVARAATESNAIRLRETNLIGVYGRAADRRALVRLSNGRYVKVKVGDQLDRGRVVAIGESEVVYQRGGRNMALRMPST